jgi:hypothetical protein
MQDPRSPRSRPRRIAIEAVEPRRVDRLEPDAVARLKEEDRLPPRHERPDRRAAEKVPAGRRLDGSHQGLHAPDGDRAGRRFQAGRDAPRSRDRRVESAEVGKARQEADHVHLVRRRGVKIDQLGWRDPVRGRRRLEVDPVLASIGDRNSPGPAGATVVSRRARGLTDHVHQCSELDRQRVVMDEEGAVGGDGLDDPDLTRQPLVEGQDAGVEAGIDRLAELDRERGVPAGQDTGSGRRRHAGSWPSRPDLATASGGALVAPSRPVKLSRPARAPRPGTP